MQKVEDGTIEQGVYRYRITVPPEANDFLGHVNNAEYVRWIQDAAVRHSSATGLDWETYQSIGGAFVVRRHIIDYLLPAQAGDCLEIATWVVSMSPHSSVRATALRNGQGRVLLTAETTWVFVSLSTMRPTRIPDAVSGRFDVLGPKPPEPPKSPVI